MLLRRARYFISHYFCMQKRAAYVFSGWQIFCATFASINFDCSVHTFAYAVQVFLIFKKYFIVGCITKMAKIVLKSKTNYYCY